MQTYVLISAFLTSHARVSLSSAHCYQWQLSRLVIVSSSYFLPKVYHAASFVSILHSSFFLNFKKKMKNVDKVNMPITTAAL